MIAQLGFAKIVSRLCTLPAILLPCRQLMPIMKA